MGKRMNSAPVYFTVGQVRFNPVLNLEKYLPAIQDKLRAARFPDFTRHITQGVIAPFGSGESGSGVINQVGYIFGDVRGASGLVLESNALALQTTAYETFEVFSESLLDGLRVVHEVLGLDFTERVGLRYLDAVLPLTNESVSDYLGVEVLGLCEKSLGSLVHTVSETMTVTPVGQLISRVIIREGQVGLPSELVALAPKLDPRFTQSIGRHAIIDTDASHVQRESFSLDAVEVKLKALHDEIWKSFAATVTSHALAAWDK
jgi:uncharacterized protein (TIGR04255 family)